MALSKLTIEIKLTPHLHLHTGLSAEARWVQQFSGANYLHTAYTTLTRCPFQGAPVMQVDQEQPDRKQLQGS